MPYSSIEEWASRIAPAPRCHKCDTPLCLGETANRPNDESGLKWLCVRCAVHLLDPTRAWFGRWSECGLTGERSTPPLWCKWTMEVGEDESQATCIRCVRDRASRLYLTRLKAV